MKVVQHDCGLVGLDSTAIFIQVFMKTQNAR